MDQGLDFPGESLTMVVMYSLPFVKRSPQMEEDFRRLREKYNSKIAFERVDLECAAKKLSQLVGRLIRKENECGVCYCFRWTILSKILLGCSTNSPFNLNSDIPILKKEQLIHFLFKRDRIILLKI